MKKGRRVIAHTTLPYKAGSGRTDTGEPRRAYDTAA
jgi:hypothetical protein